MNDLTTILTTKTFMHSHDESPKQGSNIMFDSAKSQVVTRFSIPSMTILMEYRGLSLTEIQALRTAYEANYANTFLATIPLDTRPDFMDGDTSVWKFDDFGFSKMPGGCFSAKATLTTSLLFNFTEYTDIITESSTNTLSTTTNTDFKILLDSSSPVSAEYGYENMSLNSMIGRSTQQQKDKGSLLRRYRLAWILEETEFLELLMFYRKRSGIMGQIGMPDIEIDSGVLVNSRFSEDSMQYVKRVDGLYECALETVEVK